MFRINIESQSAIGKIKREWCKDKVYDDRTEFLENAILYIVREPKQVFLCECGCELEVFIHEYLAS